MPEAVTQERYAKLLQVLHFGASVAEDDPMLLVNSSRVETAAFSEVLNDRVDIIPGTKGSGKTALFRIFVEILAQPMVDTRRTIVLKAVEPQGDPIFKAFAGDFGKLSEAAFENFWRVYLLSFINVELFEKGNYTRHFEEAKSEIKKFRSLAKKQGLPIDTTVTLDGLIRWVLTKVRKVKVSGGLDVTTGNPFLSLEGISEEKDVPPVFVHLLTDALRRVLKKARLKVWVMLDRLDEVFDRRSALETRALRALLRTTRSFTSDELRLKLFLRDDIFGDITESGFTALDHILGRKCDTLTWTKSQIGHLILNRVFAAKLLRDHFDVSQQRLRTDSAYREVIFSRIFPERIGPGRGQPTLDWIYSHCQDGRNIVTPRDVIDLLTFARTNQIDILKQNRFNGNDLLLGAEALMHGYRAMSRKKKEGFLQGEFASIAPLAAKFAKGKATHDDKSLKGLLGDGWDGHVEELVAVGFFRPDAKPRTYSIPWVFRPCFDIKQGRHRSQ